MSSVFNRDSIFIAVLILLSLYMCFNKIPFPGTDDMIFKEPAYRISMGLTPAAPSAFGRYEGIERLAVYYPPVYFFLLGGWYYILGFSLTSSLIFSLLICGLVALLFIHLLKKALGSPLPFVAYGLTLVVWSICVNNIDRLDPLYIALGLLLILILKKINPQANDFKFYILSTLLIGLSLATSPIIGVILLPFYFTLFLSHQGLKINSILKFGSMAIGGILICLLLWAAIFINEPYLFKSQFIDEIFYQSRSITWSNLSYGINFLGVVHHLYLFLPLMLFLFISSVLFSIRGVIH